MKKDEYSNTTENVVKYLSPEKKLFISMELYYSAKMLKKAWLKKIHPEWTEMQIKNKVNEIFIQAKT